MKFFYYAVACIFLLLSCTSEKGADEARQAEGTGVESPAELAEKSPLSEAASDYSIKIEPQDGFRNTAFKLSSKNFELSDTRIQWIVSGVAAEGAEDISFSLQNPDHGKGDTVQAKAVIDGKEVISNSVRIKNSPPEFTTIKLKPEVFKPGDIIYVEALVNDIDGDEVTISYNWLKNGEPAGNTMQIDSPLKRGDRISITLVPFDGEDYGSRAVVDRTIENFPPMIIEDTEFSFDGTIYTHRVRAKDPDEDPLKYSFKSAGDNMSIDSETGVIKWNVPKDFTGNVPVTVAVTDGHGGESTRQLIFSINAAVKEKDSSKEVQQSGNSPLEKGD